MMAVAQLTEETVNQTKPIVVMTRNGIAGIEQSIHLPGRRDGILPRANEGRKSSAARELLGSPGVVRRPLACARSEQLLTSPLQSLKR